MAQYLDQAGLNELVKKTKEYARKSAKEAVNPGASSASKTITGWNEGTSAAIYSPIQIEESQVTGLVDHLAEKAPLVSPNFTGVPTAPTADTSASSTQIATTQFVKNVVGNIGEAMHYKGAVDGTHPLPLTGYVAGDTWKVAAAGTYAGIVCEVGDMIIANKNYAAGTASNADWDVIQTNIDGAVTGPGSSTSGHFAIFNGDTGKVIMDAGYGLDHFKVVQHSAAFIGGALATVKDIQQNENGEISVSFQDIQSASTSQPGVVQLAGEIRPTGQTDNNKAATEQAVRDAINALDYSRVTVGTSETLSYVEEIDGRISVGTQSISIGKGQVSGLVDTLGSIATSAETLDKKIDAVSAAVDNQIAGLDANVNSTGGVNVSANIIEQNGVITSLTFVDKSVNATDVQNAINDLDAEVSSSDGTNVNVKVKEVDGKITAVNIIKDTTVNSGDVSTMITSAINDLDVEAITSESGAAATITSISETDGKISATYSPIAITSAQVTNLGQTLSDALSSVIDGLDVTASAIPTSGTITSISETDGKIAITSGAISISVNQIYDLSRITETEIDNLFVGD